MSKASIIVEKDHDGFILNSYGPFGSEESAQETIDTLLGTRYNFDNPATFFVIESVGTPIDFFARVEQIKEENE